VEIYAKNAKFGYMNPNLGKLGATHEWTTVVDDSLESPLSTFYSTWLTFFR